MKRLAFATSLSAALLLSGCASLGGNIKGNFQCQAPDGICAPTSKIDDQALAVLNSEAGHGSAPTTMSNAPTPQAHSDHALKVVLPARTDRFGRWRDTTVVYVEPDTPAPRGSAPALPSASAAPARLSLVDLAAGAPDLYAFDQDVTVGGTARPALNPAPAIKRQVDRALAHPLPSAAAPAQKAPGGAPPTGAEAAPAASPEAVRAPGFPALGAEGEH